MKLKVKMMQRGKVNENHQSKIHDNLVKNVALIQGINDNISKQHQQRQQGGDCRDLNSSITQVLTQSISDDDCGTAYRNLLPANAMRIIPL
ncbi:hypothetical protein F0562_022089 [Nyssa sinensis]|uniref:Protein EARLY FLOWERING 4 domain-containing protein n=1 Tax=Nyssa sinensis TaxID=561372 RepID=A0A5J5BM44_9ASTE|nr:hypothetical protein F0562_022089 [Nyssa sinensis]